jgi:hypothetical protein
MELNTPDLLGTNQEFEKIPFVHERIWVLLQAGAPSSPSPYSTPPSVKNRGGSYQGKCAIHFLAWHGSGELVDLPGEVCEDQRYVGTKYYCYLEGSLDAWRNCL